MWWSLPLVGREILAGGEDAVGYGGGFDCGTDLVGAEDVGAGEDGGYVGGGGGVEAIFHGGRGALEKNRKGRVLGDGVREETFAGGSGKDGQVEPAELVEVGEEWVVFVEFLAEAEAGVQDDFVARDTGGSGGLEALGEFGEDEGKDLVWRERWEGWPVLRAASGMHQDGSAVEVGAGGGHVGVPEVAADVVDDFCSGFDGVAGGAGVEGVDGEDGFGTSLEDGFDDGEDAGLFFFGGEGRGVGAGGFAPDVEDVGAFVEHRHGLGEGAFGSVLGGVEVAAVGERVGCDVEDAHDEGSAAQSECAGAEVPVVMAAGRERHGRTV
jgi:hypothetical protein